MADISVLSFTGDGLIVVQSRIAGTPQEALIRDAASIGQLAGELNSTFTVRANPGQPWTLRVRHQLPNGQWEDSPIRLGAKSIVGGVPVQFVECERTTPSTSTSDFADLVLRVEHAQATAQPNPDPGPGPGPQPGSGPGVAFIGSARVVVHANGATVPQQVNISAASQGNGDFPGTLGNSLAVAANGNTPWVLLLREKKAGAPTFTARPLVVGARTLRADLQTQFLSSDNGDVTLRVEQQLTQVTPDQEFVVRGRVSWAQGDAFAGTLKIFDIDLRHEQLLGTVMTDVAGNYELKYRLAGFSGVELKTADLRVRAVATIAGAETILGESPIVFNAAPVQVIDLVLTGAPTTALSEYELIEQRILPLLDGARASELDDSKDVEFLAGETGEPADRVWFFVRANRFAAQLPNVPPMALYGLLREGAGLEFATLLENSPEQEKALLLKAGAESVIAIERLGASVDAIVAALQAGRKGAGVSRIKSLLTGVMAVPDPALGKLIDTELAHTGTPEQFWTKVGALPEFSAPGKVFDLKFAVQAYALTDGNLSLARLIQQKRPAGAADARALTDLGIADWEGLIRQSLEQGAVLPTGLAGEDDAQRITSYARGLALTVEGAFATTVVGKKAAQGVGVDIALAKRILADNPTLDLKLPTPIGIRLPADEDERQRALETLAVLRREALTFPGVNLRQVIVQTATPPAPPGTVPPLTTVTSPARQALARVFAQRPSFDLTTRRSIDLLASDGDALLGDLAPDARAAVEDALRATQRLYNVVPKADYVNYLLGQGLSSATRLARVSESRFVLEHGPSLGGETVAKIIHRAARRQAAGAATVFALINRAVNEVNPVALGGARDASSIVEQLPNWANLFGQLELADCSECRSVHGPAAYFVDLLNMLDEAPVPDGRTAPMASLDLRRPDLLDLELTCENTHTEISHADLTNAVMSAFVARLRAAAGLPAVSTAALLADAVYPFSLPLDLPLESERRHLAVLGASRADVLSLYLAPSSANQQQAATEWLGLSPRVVEILVEDSATPVDVFFGLDPTDTSPGRVRLADLAKPRVFLERTGLTFIELLQLLNVRSLAEGSARLGLTPATSGDPADLDSRTVTGVGSAPLLVRLHRFLRLWRALQRRMPELSLLELDAALVALDRPDADPESRRRRLLESLALGEQARAALRLDLLNVLPLWGTLDTVRGKRVDENGVRVAVPSFYESVFRDARLGDDPDFRLNDDGTLAGAAKRLADKKPALQAALRVSEADLDAILSDATLSEASLSIPNLSVAYRYAVLSRALRSSVREVIAARRFSGVDPFLSPRETLRFLALWDTFRAAKFRVSELDYVLLHRADLDGSGAPPPDAISALRQSLLSKLAKVDADTDPNTPDPGGERLRGLLADLFGAATPELPRALAIVDGVSGEAEAARQAFIAEHFAFLSTALRTLLATNVAGTSSESARARKDRRQQVFAGIQLFQRGKQRRDAVLEMLSGAVGLPATLVRTLLDGTSDGPLLVSITDPAEPLLSDFQDPANAERFARAYLRLQKVATLVSRFSLDEEEVVFFQENGTHFGGLDLNALPIESVATDPLPFSFAAWLSLARFAALEAVLPRPLAGAPTLLRVFEVALQPSASFDAVIDELALVSGWSDADLVALATARGLDADVARFADPAEIEELRRGIDLARRLGVSAAKLVAWAAMPADAAQAQDVREALKAKFDQVAWERVAGPIDDELRDLQREGLVAFILSLKNQANLRQALTEAGAFGLESPNELFEYLLIDVEMTAVMKTSRLVQATASVQMFVQRILLNLEPSISPRSIEADRWKWMKQFRVWEANRKVFLYPENYLEPELRDDKTPFFRELETDLKQGDVTPATVEAAYLSYLRKLDDVAHIEIVGHCHDPQTDVHHVFGRTHDDPPSYFYRRFQENAWTGWERVPLEIESGHIAPVVYRRRLYLFWGIFKEKATDPDSSQLQALEGNPSGGRQPRRRWEVSLGFSEYQNGKWAPKRVASGEKGSARHPASTGSLSLVEESTAWEGSTAPTPTAATGNDLAMFFSNFLVPINQNPPPSRFTSELDLYRLNVSQYTDGVPQLFVNLELMANAGSGSGSGRTAHFLHLGFWNLVRTGLSLAARAAFNQGWVDLRPSGWGGGGMSWRLPGDLRLLTPIGLLSSNAQRNVPGMEESLILGRAPNGSVLFSPQDWMPLFAPPFPSFFYQDGERTYFVTKRETAGKRWQTDQYLYPRALEVLKYANELPFTTLRLGRADAGFATSFPSYSGSGATVGLPRLAFGGYWREVQVTRVHFATHYHRHTSALIESLNTLGIDAMLARVNQAVDDAGGVFRDVYRPTSLVHPDVPREDFDFRPEGAYSVYNWELFFHIPMLLAGRLSREQRFEEALRFYHYVFNPTNNDPGSDLSPQRVWRFRPFQTQTETGRIQDLLLALADPEGDSAIKSSLRDQIAQWARHPFEPHRIARLRLGAYERNVFFKYIENLLAWGDQLFARDTRESINEATQLYVMVSRLLGPRQQRIPDTPPPALTYRQLRPRIDDFGNALVDVEDQISTNALGAADLGWVESTDADGAAVVGFAETLYFCIPQNRKLLGYWDTVDDRLFKIRHGLNLQGIARSLSLFAPELDPAALVRAAAAGLDIGQVVSNLETPLGFYRFNFLLPKALQLCDEVKSFGAALLSALEKRDAEALGNLRARHDAGLLELVRRVRESQIEEAEITRRGLERSQEMLQFRRDYFLGLQRINPREQEHLAALDAAEDLQTAAQVSEALSAVLFAVPSFNIGFAGFGGSPTVTGTISLGAVSHAAAQVLGYFVGRKTFQANRAALLGSWDRRQEDWAYQANLASKELAQVEQQIAAASVRIGIAERELENHDRQIENAREVEAFLRDKFTNEELYGWMVAEVSGLFFQAYQLAYQMAKQVERTFRFERGLRDSSFVAFGAWDSLRKGLLSGERLSMDLRRLEMAYLQQNAREYELTKNVSLLLHDPAALITLKETGQCEFRLPEELFDLDHPGHFMRRVKSVSVTVPCVTGPFSGVHGTLTLISSRIRVTDQLLAGSEPYREQAPSDPRFVVDFTATQSIATSTGQNDAGLFEVSLRDDRYLPFEGAGTISDWRLELPKATNGFDFDTITDVIVRVQYAAREGGEALRSAALAAAVLPPSPGVVATPGEALVQPDQTGQARMFSARHEFPDAWHAFLRPASAEPGQRLLLDLAQDRFPLRYRGKRITVTRWSVLFKWTDAVALGSGTPPVYVSGSLSGQVLPPGATGGPQVTFNSLGTVLAGTAFADASVNGGLGAWTLGFTEANLAALAAALRTPNGTAPTRLNADLVDDIVVIAHYDVTS